MSGLITDQFKPGNIPVSYTHLAPLLIMSKLEQYKYSDATAIALVLLIISFALMFIINSIQLRMQKFSEASTDTGVTSIQKVVAPQKNDSSRMVKYILIGISIVFLVIMLILPLAVVIVNRCV